MRKTALHHECFIIRYGEFTIILYIKLKLPTSTAALLVVDSMKH